MVSLKGLNLIYQTIELVINSSLFGNTIDFKTYHQQNKML